MEIGDYGKNLDFLTDDQFDQLKKVFEVACFEEYRLRLSAFDSESERTNTKLLGDFFRAWQRLPEDLKDWVRDDLRSIAASHGADIEEMLSDPMSFDLSNLEKLELKRISRSKRGSPPKYPGHKEAVSLLVDFWCGAGYAPEIGRPESNTKNLDNYETTPLVRFVAFYLLKIDPKFLPEAYPSKHLPDPSNKRPEISKNLHENSKKKRDPAARLRAYELRAYSALDDLRATIRSRRSSRAN